MAAEGTMEIHTGAGPLAVASTIIIRYSIKHHSEQQLQQLWGSVSPSISHPLVYTLCNDTTGRR